MKSIEELNFTKKNIKEVSLNPFAKIGDDWFLITAGDEEKFNMMTASWGFMGVMWGKNEFISVIRPQRYTKEFVDKSEYYTASFFKSDMKKALTFCGTHSGKDYDKVKETGLTPIKVGDSISFAEADMILLIKKDFVQKMEKNSFVGTENAEKWYPTEDFHFEYIGEIVEAYVRN